MKLATILMALALLAFAPTTASAEDCLLCAKDSDKTCEGAQQCRGTREHCREIGCKITGTASCSTAANVKICESAQPELQPQWSGEMCLIQQIIT